MPFCTPIPVFLCEPNSITGGRSWPRRTLEECAPQTPDRNRLQAGLRAELVIAEGLGDLLMQLVPTPCIEREHEPGLRPLEDLRRQGAITEGEYAKRRQELLGAAGR